MMHHPTIQIMFVLVCFSSIPLHFLSVYFFSLWCDVPPLCITTMPPSFAMHNLPFKTMFIHVHVLFHLCALQHIKSMLVLFFIHFSLLENLNVVF